MAKNKTIDEILETAINIIENSKNEYIDYYKLTENQNLKHLLLSIVEQKKEHLKRIKELKLEGNLENIFKCEGPPDIDTQDIKYSRDIKYLDFLQLIIKRDEVIRNLYQFLMNCSLNQDVELLFKRLEFDMKKQISIITDRYELEKINMGN